MSTHLPMRLESRHVNLDFRDTLSGQWNGDDPFKTVFFNSMSILFPLGELSFIENVRNFSGFVDSPVLREQIQDFIGQEAAHRREHRRFNERLCSVRGYDLDYLERRIKNDVDASKRITPIVRLALTVAYEHLTATIAGALLAEPSWLPANNYSVAQMWRWHAIEEIEHRSVAYDVYLAAGGSRKLLRTMAIYMSFEFLIRYMPRNVVHMLRRDGVPLRLAFWGGVKFIFGHKGLLQKCWSPYWRFYKSGFHPSDVDSSEIIRTAAERYGLLSTSRV